MNGARDFDFWISFFLSEFVGFYNVLFENEHGDTAQQLRVPGPGEVSTQGPGGEDPMADPV